MFLALKIKDLQVAQSYIEAHTRKMIQHAMACDIYATSFYAKYLDLSYYVIGEETDT